MFYCICRVVIVVVVEVHEHYEMKVGCSRSGSFHVSTLRFHTFLCSYFLYLYVIVILPIYWAALDQSAIPPNLNL